MTCADPRTGGTIEPKNAKFLAIPISDAARAGSPRMMGNLAYVQSIKGQPMLVDSTTGTVHYLLRKRVTIPARPYLRPAADASIPILRATSARNGRSCARPVREVTTMLT
jgi:hypothetical protein